MSRGALTFIFSALISTPYDIGHRVIISIMSTKEALTLDISIYAPSMRSARIYTLLICALPSSDDPYCLPIAAQRSAQHARPQAQQRRPNGGALHDSRRTSRTPNHLTGTPTPRTAMFIPQVSRNFKK